MIQTHQDNSTNLAKLEAMLQDDPSKYLHRLDRAAFTNEQLFELKPTYIYEGNWVYLLGEQSSSRHQTKLDDNPHQCLISGLA